MGGDGGAVCGEQVAGELDGVADGALVDAEDAGEHTLGHRQVLAEQGDGELRGEVELAAAGPGGPARGAAGAAAPGVEPLLAGGQERGLQGGGQGCQILAGHPGQCWVG